MKLLSASHLQKWGITLGLTACYWIVAVWLIPLVGDGVLIGAVIPVIAAGWFFGVEGGVISSFLSTILSVAILLMFGGFTWNNVISGEVLFGNCMVLLVGVITGMLRRNFDGRLQIENQLHLRERYMTLLNEMTHTIIASRDFDALLNILVKDMSDLLEADSCYITRWDETLKKTIPWATSENLDQPYASIDIPVDELTITKSVLSAGRVLVAEDVFNSPYISPNVSRKFPALSILGIPLIFQDHKLGALIIAFKAYHHFSQDEIERAEQAGNQISLVLWDAQQDMELEHRLREANTLANISRALSETERVGLSTVLQLIATSTKELIPISEQAVIHLLDEEQQILTAEAVVGYADNVTSWKLLKIRPNEGVAGLVIVSGETINIADVRTDSRFLMTSSFPSYRSLMVAPVQSGKKKLGTISAQSSLVGAFTQDESRLLSALGTQAAIAIENAHLLESTQQALKESNALYRINQGLIASLDAQELFQDVVELLQKNFGYYHVQIFIVDPETGDFVIRAASGEVGRQLMEQGHRLRAGEGIVGYTAETDAPFFTNNVDELVSFVRNPLLPNTKSELAVPVKIEERIVGLLDIQQIPPSYLTQRDIQLVSAVANQLAIALQKAELYTDLQASLQVEKSIRNQMVQSERLSVMGRLLASVSHELNNPLQAIQNALFLLRDEKGISAQGKQDLEIVLSEAERMSELIGRLRATYRSSQMEDFQLAQLNNIIEDVYALIATHLRHNEIAFEFHPDSELPMLPVLTDQIRQVLLNLLMNAVEAMTTGGRLIVSTRLLADSGEILLRISDTGSGIDPSILPNIFEPFVTDKERGTGLGLTITYDIILKHRGRIQAENNPQGGATFSVWLPVENRNIG